MKEPRGKTGKTGPRGPRGPGWNLEDIGLLHEKLDTLGTDVQELTKVIWKGNGTPAILMRLDRIEVASQTNAETVKELTKDVMELTTSVTFCKDEIVKHPSINRWIASSPTKAMVTVGGFIVSFTAVLIGLHALISLPGVSLLVEKILGLP